MSRIGVFGAGYVGLVTGVCLAELGHEVVVGDIDPERVTELNLGVMPIYEPGLEQLVTSNRERLHFTGDMAEVAHETEFLFVCVGTPPTYSGDADLSAIWQVVDNLPPLGRSVVVMKSTVPLGTGQRVRARLDARGLSHVGYVSNPEFLAEGSAVELFLHPDRIVLGTFADAAADADGLERLYGPLEAPVLRTDVASAELVKLASNGFLAAKISFVNEIANICELTGANVDDVAAGMGLDARIGARFLRAGIGFGGSCFPKDVEALKQHAANLGYHFQLLSAVMEVNELQKRRVLQKLERHLGSLSGRRIALLGLAYKPGTNDLREASSVVLAGRLLAEGADVRAWDPVADVHARVTSRRGIAAREILHNVTVCESPLEALEGADAAVLVTEWPELRELPLARVRDAMRRPIFIDGRNFLDPDAARAAGLVYEGIGRPFSPLVMLPESIPDRAAEAELQP